MRWEHTVSQGCGALEGERTFKLKDVHPETCCQSASAFEPSLPVEVSALKFCSALIGHIVKQLSASNPLLAARKQLRPKLCEELLIGTASSNGEWYSKAAELSRHPASHGLHLDPLVTSKSHHLLKQVCKDECHEIVKNTIVNMQLMADVQGLAIPPEQTCADRVVRKVEAEILGCCGRSCGWNKRTCAALPFFNKSEKVMWLEECCTELNVLSGSSRERMCDSVLTPGQVQLVSKLDQYTKAKSGTDVGGVFIGQDPRLLWTKDGLLEFKHQVKKLKRVPKDGDLVDSEFLEDYPDLRETGIEKGWFKLKQEDIFQEKRSSTSLVQADGCTPKGMDPCHEDTKRPKIKKCMAGAMSQVSDKPDPDFADDETCQMILNNKAATPVATPDDCLEAKFSIEEFGAITRRFFEYKAAETKLVGQKLQDVIPDALILCYVESVKYTCGHFVRQKFEQPLLDALKTFHDYRYWIDEKDVPIRLKQIPEDDARADAAVQ